jgi:hypothetical protein
MFAGAQGRLQQQSQSSPELGFRSSAGELEREGIEDLGFQLGGGGVLIADEERRR